jgi:hypothetical protein
VANVAQKWHENLFIALSAPLFAMVFDNTGACT